MKLDLNKTMAAGMRGSILAAMAITTGAAACAQTGDTQFTVCTLNVDGLPNTINGINVNPDGKGAEGAAAIGSYISSKGYDVVALSEDFNYHANLASTLGADYTIGTWRGGVDASAIVSSANTDGLCFLTKQPTSFSGETWTQWSKSYGKLDNGNDGLIKKGYRYYTVALANGTLVDFYTFHMDAGTSDGDLDARASQWKQISEAVLANKNNRRPVIVMGDTNSRYTRDDIRSLFIDPISTDGAYSVGDAWIELCKNGEYPTLGDDALVIPDDQKKNSEAYREYEIVDKVIYLNPTFEGAAHITPQSINFDANGYIGEDGELMGDHTPLAVSFTAEAATATDIPVYAPAEASAWWRGEDIAAGKEAYIYNVGLGYFITSDTKPTYKTIANAQKWLATATGNGLTFASGTSRIYMEKKLSWSAGIKENSGATTFNVVKSDISKDVNAYKLTATAGFKKETRYFNIDTDNSIHYSAAQTNDTPNDWLFISEDQRKAYDKYVSLFTQANAYVGNKNVNEALAEELADVLEQTGKSSYTTSAADCTALDNIIAKLKEGISTTIGKPTAANATPAAIYTIDGKRVGSMQRGVNIVRMSDGTVRKIVRNK